MIKIRPSYAYFLAYNKDNTFRAAEIGVREGYNAFQLLNTTDRLENIILADNYLDDNEKYEYDMKELLKPFWYRIDYKHMDSISASKLVKDNSLDYVYIDGDHEELPVLADLEAWYPKVKIGGMFAGHDWWYKGVRAALQTFANKVRPRLFACQNMFGGTTLSSEEGEFMDWWWIKHA